MVKTEKEVIIQKIASILAAISSATTDKDISDILYAEIVTAQKYDEEKLEEENEEKVEEENEEKVEVSDSEKLFNSIVDPIFNKFSDIEDVILEEIKNTDPKGDDPKKLALNAQYIVVKQDLIAITDAFQDSLMSIMFRMYSLKDLQ